jgi:hypothetical protein
MAWLFVLFLAVGASDGIIIEEHFARGKEWVVRAEFVDRWRSETVEPKEFEWMQDALKEFDSLVNEGKYWSSQLVTIATADNEKNFLKVYRHGSWVPSAGGCIAQTEKYDIMNQGGTCIWEKRPYVR